MNTVALCVAEGALLQSKCKPLSRLIHTSLLRKFAETQRSFSLIPVENPLKSSLTVAYDHREIQWWHAGLCGIAVRLCGQTGEAQALQAECRCHQLVSEKKSDGEVMWHGGKLKLSIYPPKSCKRSTKLSATCILYYIKETLPNQLHTFLPLKHTSSNLSVCNFDIFSTTIISCTLDSAVDTLQWLIVWCLWFYEGILSLDWENQQLVCAHANLLWLNQTAPVWQISLLASPAAICLCMY